MNWWKITWADCVVIAALLLMTYAVVGPPSGWGWLVVAPGVLAGRFAVSVLTRGRKR